MTIWGEDAVETQEVDSRWGRDAGQPPKEVDRTTHEVSSPIWTRPFHVVADAPIGQQLQSLFGDGASPGVEAQSLERLPVVGVEVLAGVQREAFTEGATGAHRDPAWASARGPPARADWKDEVAATCDGGW